MRGVMDGIVFRWVSHRIRDTSQDGSGLRDLSGGCGENVDCTYGSGRCVRSMLCMAGVNGNEKLRKNGPLIQVSLV